ncbi:nematode fatty acid retinoid binding protein [Oesophagostomum dentatum]|uniref:Fatty-acid and retinol-binding protein 1 n=1 Tax=Oesophagostomum dentatum TaxID=61180 RepID=A0A0B1TSK8_OESDE|nr:nematode fatty acid retinoid binding protein [Oesophagostomum dentatum]
METIKSRNEPAEERLIIAAIKKKAPELGAILQAAKDRFQAKLDALGPEAKDFAKEIWENGRKIRNQLFAGNRPTPAEMHLSTLGTLIRYKKLSAAAKEEFGKQFPVISNALTGITSLPIFSSEPGLAHNPILGDFLAIMHQAHMGI